MIMAAIEFVKLHHDPVDPIQGIEGLEDGVFSPLAVDFEQLHALDRVLPQDGCERERRNLNAARPAPRNSEATTYSEVEPRRKPERRQPVHTADSRILQELQGSVPVRDGAPLRQNVGEPVEVDGLEQAIHHRRRFDRQHPTLCGECRGMEREDAEIRTDIHDGVAWANLKSGVVIRAGRNDLRDGVFCKCRLLICSQAECESVPQRNPAVGRRMSTGAFYILPPPRGLTDLRSCAGRTGASSFIGSKEGMDGGLARVVRTLSDAD